MPTTELPDVADHADIDHFKKLNDTHGHSAGDEVLRHAALCRTVRETDFAARYGGEEFVVVAPDCPPEGALAMAERFRTDLSEMKVQFRNHTLRVTCSVGVAPAFESGQTEPQELLDMADQALYRAKGAGRNATWVWDPVVNAPVAADPMVFARPAPARR